MSTEDNKMLVRRQFDEIWNKGNWATPDRYAWLHACLRRVLKLESHVECCSLKTVSAGLGPVEVPGR